MSAREKAIAALEQYARIQDAIGEEPDSGVPFLREENKFKRMRDEALTALRAEDAAGREERAAVVNWLRERANLIRETRIQTSAATDLYAGADAIEAGHHRGTT